ncbi:MFS transporter [Melioribacteraceae bacterium 4301-Me]|uniref:MFS transporter n=1 Tax=Pyranulibacter aquaticus TaxID=3163344 RepID=UPI0035970112
MDSSAAEKFNNESEKKSISQIVKESFKELEETFLAFVKAPKALWGINLPYVIEGLVYFGILTVLGKFCSENVKLTDIQAGWVYSFVTGGITLAMVILGGYSDKIGVRRSLILAFAVMLIGRIFLAGSDTLHFSSGFLSPMFFVLIIGLFFMVVGYGLYQPAAYAGVKRYTTPKTAPMAYGAIYGLMNLGAFFSGFVSPLVRHHNEKNFPPNGLAAVLWVYVVLTLISLLFTVILITKKSDKDAYQMSVEASDSKSNKGTKNEAKRNINNTALFIYSFATVLFFIIYILTLNKIINTESEIIPTIFLLLACVSFIISVWEFLRQRPEHPFRDKRFVFFIFILIPVQTLFAHNWLTIPYYTDRAFVGTAVSKYFEFFSNINPVLIFVLAPLVAGLTSKANVYRMMVLGTFVMALPTFLLAIGPNIYLFLSYVLIAAIGEAMWQPRFLQWIAEIAPEGKTGAYMGIGQLPWFLTKVITGLYSGYFVEKYIPRPESGLPQNTQMLWLIYGIIAIVSPVALLLAKNWMIKGFKTRNE